MNSPSLRVRKGGISKDNNRGSPYGKNSRRSQRLLSSPGISDAQYLISPGRTHSASFVADKHVIIKKPEEGKVGMKFRDCTELGGRGVLLTGIEPGSVAAASTLLVGDIISSIDGTATDTSELAALRAPPSLRALKRAMCAQLPVPACSRARSAARPSAAQS